MPGPTNNKSRATGSGTTSQARRQQREGKQWTSLAMADPPITSSQSFEEKEEALKKALASLQEKKAEALEKEQEEAAALKKVEEQLEKHLAKGKNGPRSRSQSRARLTPREEVLKKAALKERLDNHLKQLERETKPERRTHSRGPLKKGPKGEKSGSSSLKKEKPCVVLDWHNTLEKGNQMPPASLEALEKLLTVVDVHIISWVGSQDRFEKTLDQIPKLLGSTVERIKSYGLEKGFEPLEKGSNP